MPETLWTNITIIVVVLFILGFGLFFYYWLSKSTVCLAEKLSKKINIEKMRTLKLNLLEFIYHIVLSILVVEMLYIPVNQEHITNFQAIIFGLCLLIGGLLIIFLGTLFSSFSGKYNHKSYLYKAITYISKNTLFSKAKNNKWIKLLLSYFKIMTADYLFLPIWFLSIYVLLTFLVILEWPETYYPIVSFCFFISSPILTVCFVYFMPADKAVNKLEVIDLRRIIVYVIFVVLIIWDANRKYLNLFLGTMSVKETFYDILVYMLIGVYLALDRLFKIIVDHAHKKESFW